MAHYLHGDFSQLRTKKFIKMKSDILKTQNYNRKILMNTKMSQ